MQTAPTAPIIQPFNGELYTLVEDYEATACGVKVTVRGGFLTDGASVPRMAWAFAGHPLQYPRVCAAVVHDWLYSAHPCDRKKADEIYYELLLKCGYPKWRAKVEYAMLRAFGWDAWADVDPGDAELGDYDERGAE